MPKSKALEELVGDVESKKFADSDSNPVLETEDLLNWVSGDRLINMLARPAHPELRTGFNDGFMLDKEYSEVSRAEINSRKRAFLSMVNSELQKRTIDRIMKMPYDALIKTLSKWVTELQTVYPSITAEDALRYTKFLYFDLNKRNMRSAVLSAIDRIETDEFNKLHELLLAGSPVASYFKDNPSPLLTKKRINERKGEVMREWKIVLEEYSQKLESTWITPEQMKIILRRPTDEEIFRHNPYRINLVRSNIASAGRYSAEMILRDGIFEFLGIDYGTKGFTIATSTAGLKVRLGDTFEFVFKEVPAIFEDAIKEANSRFYASMKIPPARAISHIEPYMFAMHKNFRRARFRGAIELEMKLHLFSSISVHKDLYSYALGTSRVKLEKILTEWIDELRDVLKKQYNINSISDSYALVLFNAAQYHAVRGGGKFITDRAAYIYDFFRAANVTEDQAKGILTQTNPTSIYRKIKAVKKLLESANIPIEKATRYLYLPWLNITSSQLLSDGYLRRVRVRDESNRDISFICKMMSYRIFEETVEQTGGIIIQKYRKGNLPCPPSISPDNLREYVRISVHDHSKVRENQLQLVYLVGHYQAVVGKGIPCEVLRHLYEGYSPPYESARMRGFDSAIRPLIRRRILTKFYQNGIYTYRVNPQLLKS